MLLESHPGFKAKLNSSICKTALYFADRAVEVIFNVPYLIHLPPNNTTANEVDNDNSSSNNNNNNNDESLSTIFKNISSDDSVCIIWIEDIISMQNIPSKIGQPAFIYIFVNPLQNATGLYWIRIITPIVTYQGSIGVVTGAFNNFSNSSSNEKKSGKGRVSWFADTTKLAENPLVK